MSHNSDEVKGSDKAKKTQTLQKALELLDRRLNPTNRADKEKSSAIDSSPSTMHVQWHREGTDDRKVRHARTPTIIIGHKLLANKHSKPLQPLQFYQQETDGGKAQPVLMCNQYSPDEASRIRKQPSHSVQGSKNLHRRSNFAMQEVVRELKRSLVCRATKLWRWRRDGGEGGRGEVGETKGGESPHRRQGSEEGEVGETQTRDVPLTKLSCTNTN